MTLTCNVCDTKLYGDGGWLDVVKCPKCLCMTSTGHEGRLRKELESYKNHLPYPRAAVGRAIGYAAGIYDLSTHNKRIDVSVIEQKLEKKLGAKVRAEHTSLGLIRCRSGGGVTDSRAGLMVYQVSGNRQAAVDGKGQEWALIYVVFRGSRGDKAGSSDNPQGAGWGETASGEKNNVDWRANLKTAQATPGWSAEVKIHAGFLEVYGSVRDTVHRTVSTYLSKTPHAAVIVTGHSLGAALATVCAHDLECSGICKPFCFPFCSPRCGDLAFARDFNQKISNDKGVLDCETGGAAFNRAFVFVQSNDPVSWSGKHGFKHAMSEKSAIQVADKGGIVKKGIYASLKKTQSDTLIYYHVGNLYRASFLGLHSYEAMQRAILG